MPLNLLLFLFPAVSFAETADYAISQDSIPKITVRCTADLVNGWESQLFPKDETYYGIYVDEKVKNKCTATRITGKDTLVNITGKALTPMIIPDQQNQPAFIVTNLPLKDGQWLMGKTFPNRMLFPGESIPFMGSWLYATDYKCFDVILFLSSKAEVSRLLGEAARHRTCRC